MNKKILRLAIPNIISNITIPLLGIVDMGLMGHLGDEKYIGAIALGGVIFNILYWGFAFLRMGTSGLTAQAYGAKDEQKQINLLALSVIMAILFSLLAITLQRPIEWLSFKLIEGSTETELLAAQYFRIRIFAAPATISLFAISGWFIGMQNARFPMIISIFINMVNIGLSYYLVVIKGLKSDGVAIGTVIAQYSGLLIAIILLRIKYGNLFRQIRLKSVFDLRIIKKYFEVNTNIFFRTLCIIAVFTFFTSESASTNDTILAINSLLLQFLMFFSYFIDGFAYAAEALVGKYIGAKNHLNFRQVIRNLFIWGGGLAIAFSLIYLFAGSFIVQVLTNNHSLIEASKPYLFWVILIPIFGAPSFIWDGIYIGATASKGMLYTMLGATFFIFFPSYYLLNGVLQNHALWLSMILFLFGRGFLQTLSARKYIFKPFKTVKSIQVSSN